MGYDLKPAPTSLQALSPWAPLVLTSALRSSGSHSESRSSGHQGRQVGIVWAAGHGERRVRSSKGSRVWGSEAESGASASSPSPSALRSGSHIPRRQRPPQLQVMICGQVGGGVSLEEWAETNLHHLIPRPAPGCCWGSGDGRGVFAEGAVALELRWTGSSRVTRNLDLETRGNLGTTLERRACSSK